MASHTTDTDAILRSLTLDEKISLLAGEAFWETVGILDKGVPSIKTTDGPNGCRGADIDGNTKAACFPAASSVAATFDPALARRIGGALADEARTKGARVLLGPTVCCHRHPLGGRNFESFSEDPHLSGTLATSLICGLQEDGGVAACIKHFVANEQETDRMTVNETIGERALREIYLRPFETAVRDARPWSLMTAYNLVNGVHCDSHDWLLRDVLRGEWGWDGAIISDWGGTNSVAGSINAGLDLEMPGPARVRTPSAVRAALEAGDVTEETINERTAALLKLIDRVGGFEQEHHPGGSPKTERAEDRPEHRELIREFGARGMVLLKNEAQILPLTKERVSGKKIALVGLAKDALAHGGGSASVNAHYKVTPWDGLAAVLRDSAAEFVYAKGVHRQRLLSPLSIDSSAAVGSITGLDGQPGFTRLLYEVGNPDPVSTLHGYASSAYSPLGSQESLNKVVELVADFTPHESGAHYMACSGIGVTTVFVNDAIVFSQESNCADPMGALFMASSEDLFRHDFVGGRAHRIRIQTKPPANIGMRILEGRSGARLGFRTASEHDADLQGEAERVARDADIAIVFTGHDPQWESEGRDQDSFDLPNGQNELVATVARANPNTIVVNTTGVAVAMPWLGDVRAVVQAWFAGQECGNAVADVLTGVVNPEGHLPVSFPRRVEDAPAHGNFPGETVNGKRSVTYAEGVFVGYRHYDRLPQESVQFPFGHGLSYTSFQLGSLQVEHSASDDDGFVVTAQVSNTGAMAGGAAVQLYVGNSIPSPEHPVKTLVAYQKARLQPGEAQTVTLLAKYRDIAHFDEKAHAWVLDAGGYEFSLGLSAVDIQAKTMGHVQQRKQYSV
ncbi:glycoside hydrolase family 3 protein [Parathielavia hyrcaniae]|uniref:beta-glucosidase n=1 Tax=Parathielavia hyrcaniae TaxID=113614 RepID=A0AAN6SW86_9PEZI|nr:glycoside hydrolase family 3 protein [Parathielavia hyrcaniae]